MKAFLYGKNPVTEWLSSGLPSIRLIAGQDDFRTADPLMREAEKQGVPVVTMSPRQLTALVGHDRHQKIALEVILPEYTDLESLFRQTSKSEEPPLLAVLDSVQDPQNLGAVLRTAECAGVHGVIIPKHDAAGMTPAVFKASAGAASHMPLVRVTNLTQTLKLLKDKGFWIIGSEEKAAVLLDEVDYRPPTVIVLGSEGMGLHRLVREHCDFLVSIPMFGKIGSLNVSVAAGLLFYEARRQRMSGRKKSGT